MYNDLDNVDQVSTHVFLSGILTRMHIYASLMPEQSYNSPLLGLCVSTTKAPALAQTITLPLFTWHRKRRLQVLVDHNSKSSAAFMSGLVTQASSKVAITLASSTIYSPLTLTYRQTKHGRLMIFISIRPLEAADTYSAKLTAWTFVNTFIDSNTADDLASCIDSLYNTEKLARELAAKHSYFYFVEVEDR